MLCCGLVMILIKTNYIHRWMIRYRITKKKKSYYSRFDENLDKYRGATAVWYSSKYKVLDKLNI